MRATMKSLLIRLEFLKNKPLSNKHYFHYFINIKKVGLKWLLRRAI